MVVKNNGRRVGTYTPYGGKPDVARMRRAADEIAIAQQQMRDRGVDLDAEMAKLSMKPTGEPLDDE